MPRALHNMAMRNVLRWLAYALCQAAFFASASCGGDRAATPRQILRLDQEVQAFGALDSVQKAQAVDSLRPEIAAYCKVMRLGDDYAKEMTMLSESELVRAFQPAVDSVFPNLRSLENALGHMLERARADSLHIPPMRYAAVVWGYNQSFVKVDSVMLIALNHFLGADYPGYSHWESYQRALKTPGMLPYNLAEAMIGTNYPMDKADDATLLSHMLYQGAMVEAVMRIVPDASLADALGYSEAQMRLAKDSKDEIWSEMAKSKLVYTTDPVAIDRLMQPAPSSPLLMGSAPGRIGRYIGYLIVDKYLSNHTDANLSTILSSDFYNNVQTLINSGF